MSSTHSRIELPQPGNYAYYELPTALQLQIAALIHLEAAESALDSVERDGRDLQYADSPEDRGEWRNRQGDSLAAYRLRVRLEARAVLAYVQWLITRTQEEGDGARGPKIVALRRAEVEQQARLVALLAQEA